MELKNTNFNGCNVLINNVDRRGEWRSGWADDATNGLQVHTCSITHFLEDQSLSVLFHFPTFSNSCQFHLIWDPKICTCSLSLKKVPMERLKCFHEFQHWKSKIASGDLEFLAIAPYKEELHFNKSTNSKVHCIMSFIIFIALHLKLRFRK